MSEAIGRVLLTVGEVAGMLSISTRGVYRLVARGELPRPLTAGKRATRFKVSDIELYIRNLEMRARR